jgi:hypothetical protein
MTASSSSPSFWGREAIKTQGRSLGNRKAAWKSRCLSAAVPQQILTGFVI